MSNAMRNGKRVLAGVAAGALGMALVPFVGVTSASATAYTGETTAVRAGAIGSIPYAALAFDKASAPPTDLVVVTSPGGARMWVKGSASSAGTLPVSTDDSATLTAPITLGSAATGSLSTAGDDSVIGVAVDTAGSYTAQLGDGTDTVTFSFTTTGAPASMTLTPAEQTVLVGATAELELQVKDAAGNLTQIANGDSVAVASNTDDTVSPSGFTATTLYTGSGDITLNTANLPAGISTVTATPAGTLPSLGLTAQSATVTKSGTVSDTAVSGLAVTTPSNAIATSTTITAATAQVPSPTTSLTITIDDTTTATAGDQLRFAATTVANGFIDGVTDDTVYYLVTTDANKQATITMSLGGASAINSGSVLLQQVDVTGAPLSPAAQITVSVKTPAVNPADVVPSPSGIITQVVGTSSPVTVQVDDSFGTPLAGWIVNAVRTSDSAIVGTGTTDATGAASLSVSPLASTTAGNSETYQFQALNPVAPTPVTGTLTLQVNYETSADVTALTVAPATGTAGSWSNASPTQTAYPAIFVPADGTVSGTGSTGTYDVATATPTAGNGSDMIAFNVTTTPFNAVTVTAPEGVKVSSTAPDGTTLWSAGSQTATITGNGSTPVYVWATKTGIHELTFASTGMTVTGKIFVANTASDAYNIALSPADQSVGSGAITTVTLSVTDVFGNAVTTADDTGNVTVSASGEVLLAGFQVSDTFATGTDGTATITVIAGNSAGTGTLSATPTTGTVAPAWGTTYTPPTGAPAPVTSAAATVQVSGSPTAQAITISGERGTVRGKPGVIVDGITEGFGQGAILKPWFKFPGESSYTEGVKNILVDEDGEFLWQRRTGKKIYISIRSEDGSVKSNRLILPAK